MTLENPAASPKLQDNLTGKWFDQIFILILENHGWTQSAAMRMVNYISQFGIIFTDYHGTVHPSGPNYRSMFSGQHWSTNEFDGVKRPNIGDSIPVYQYDYMNAPAERHNPFLDMKSIEARLHLTLDMSNITAKGIHYIGMDDQNNAHSGSLDVADANVNNFIQWWNKLDNMIYRKDILFVVFDEAFGIEYIDNHVFAGMLFGGQFLSKLYAGKVITERIDHYNLANFLYNNWDIPTPAEMDKSAKIYNGQALWDIKSLNSHNSIWDQIRNLF